MSGIRGFLFTGLVVFLNCVSLLGQSQRLEITDLANRTLNKYKVNDSIGYVPRNDNKVIHAVALDFIPSGIVLTTGDTVHWSMIESIEGKKRLPHEKTWRILSIAIPMSIMATIPVAVVASNRVNAYAMEIGPAKTARLVMLGVFFAAGGIATLSYQLTVDFKSRAMERRKPDYQLLDKTYRFKWRVKGKRPFEVT
jgi:hypothetical protein